MHQCRPPAQSVSIQKSSGRLRLLFPGHRPRALFAIAELTMWRSAAKSFDSDFPAYVCKAVGSRSFAFSTGGRRFGSVSCGWHGGLQSGCSQPHSARRLVAIHLPMGSCRQLDRTVLPRPKAHGGQILFRFFERGIERRCVAPVALTPHRYRRSPSGIFLRQTELGSGDFVSTRLFRWTPFICYSAPTRNGERLFYPYFDRAILRSAVTCNNDVLPPEESIVSRFRAHVFFEEKSNGSSFRESCAGGFAYHRFVSPSSFGLGAARRRTGKMLRRRDGRQE
jgi:hypothetical protein